MGFKGVHYSELKDQLAFLPVLGKDIEETAPAFFNAMKMLESKNDKNAVFAFLQALGVNVDDNGIVFNGLDIFDVRALSKKYLASNKVKDIAAKYDYVPESDDEVDEIVDKASQLDSYKTRTAGDLAIDEVIQEYLPECDDEEEEEEEEEDEEESCCSNCPHANNEEHEEAKIPTLIFRLHL